MPLIFIHSKSSLPLTLFSGEVASRWASKTELQLGASTRENWPSSLVPLEVNSHHSNLSRSFKLTILGFGAAIVRYLASKGCNVVTNHATEDSDAAATALATELEKNPSVSALGIQADISSRAESERLVATAKDRFTSSETGSFRIDILVHNASICFLGPVKSAKENEFQRIHEVNALGSILLTGACKTYLPTDRSGRVMLLSSINSKVGTEDTTLYSGPRARWTL